MIRQMTAEDAVPVLEIYRKGLDTGDASFEMLVPDWETWDAKHHAFARLVWEYETRVLGWAALTPVSTRHCYRGVAEISIYVDIECLSRGIGNRLLTRLVEEAEAHGIWTLTSSIFPENQATRRLHLRHGFREVGIRQRIAQRNDCWRDTLIFERRSSTVGT